MQPQVSGIWVAVRGRRTPIGKTVVSEGREHTNPQHINPLAQNVCFQLCDRQKWRSTNKRAVLQDALGSARYLALAAVSLREPPGSLQLALESPSLRVSSERADTIGPRSSSGTRTSGGVGIDCLPKGGPEACGFSSGWFCFCPFVWGSFARRFRWQSQRWRCGLASPRHPLIHSSGLHRAHAVFFV